MRARASAKTRRRSLLAREQWSITCQTNKVQGGNPGSPQPGARRSPSRTKSNTCYRARIGEPSIDTAKWVILCDTMYIEKGIQPKHSYGGPVMMRGEKDLNVKHKEVRVRSTLQLSESSQLLLYSIIVIIAI